MADVLSSGPAGSGRPRRWVAVAGTVLLAGAAVLLAARSTGPGTPDAAPTAAPSPSPEPLAPTEVSVPVPVGVPGVVSVAVGRRHAYALVADCDTSAVQACAYYLHRRDVDGDAWTLLPARMETRSTLGTQPSVSVSGDEVVTLFEQPAGRVLSSADGGPFVQHEATPGPAIDEFPADGVLCSPCLGPVTVLEPATGRLRPLRSQPAFAGRVLRSVQQRGRVLWAVASGRTDVLGAVSVDHGRTWRTAPLPVDPAIDALELVIGPAGAGYLLCTTLGGPRGADRRSAVWTPDAPGRPWRRLPGPVPRGARSALAEGSGLLIADFAGTVWQLQPEGGFTALPDPGRTRPAQLAAGGQLLAATPDGAVPATLVLTSRDGGESWRTERLD